jgi:putative superfamily III holin-X
VNFQKPERSIAGIIGQLIDQITTLIRSEGALARAEMSEKVSSIAGNVSTLLAGVLLLLPGLIILLQAIVAALVRGGMAEIWASLLVGGGVLIIGFICISIGTNRLKSLSPVPKETIKQIQRDVATIQEMGRSS